MNQDTPRQLRVLPAGAGLVWLAGSLVLVRTQPARLLLLTLLMQAVLGLSQVPVLGFMVILAVPGLSAGLLQGFHMVACGQRPPMSVLFAALATRPSAGRLLALGALMFAAGLVSVSLFIGSEGGGLDPELLARIEQGDTDALAALDPAFIFRMATALAVAVSVTGVLSFLTIPLIWFSGLRVGTALVTGLRAMVVNWKAFLLLGLAMGGLLVPVLLVLGFLFRAAGPGAGTSLIALAVVMLILLLFQLVIFGTQYRAHQAIFGMAHAPPTPGPDNGDDDQLVA